MQRCGGCAQRAQALKSALQDAQKLRMRQAVQKVRVVGASMRRDARNLVRTPLGIRRK